jgi:cytochrome c peroxidase
LRFLLIGFLSFIMVLFCMQGAFAGQGLQEKAASLFEPIPKEAPTLQNNPATPEKLQLGKMLYFEPRLSASQLISCQTCHNVGLAGTDLQETSVGHGWQKGPRNAPTVFNAVFNVAQFWDGRAEDLAEQAKGPVQASIEMNNKPKRVVETLSSMPQYVERFKAAFPDEKEPVTFENVAKAIEVFEATLITPGAPMDEYIKGDADALSQIEKDGLAVYINKGCSSCHYGVNFGGKGYYPFGVMEKPQEEVRPESDLGRYEVTNTAGDKYVFKSPSLRNVALTQPYFHSGKVWSLLDAVKIMGSTQLGYTLSDEEARKVTAFLHALTGKQPKVTHPVLPPSTEETPKPILETDSGEY